MGYKRIALFLNNVAWQIKIEEIVANFYRMH